MLLTEASLPLQVSDRKCAALPFIVRGSPIPCTAPRRFPLLNRMMTAVASAAAVDPLCGGLPCRAVLMYVWLHRHRVRVWELRTDLRVIIKKAPAAAQPAVPSRLYSPFIVKLDTNRDQHVRGLTSSAALRLVLTTGSVVTFVCIPARAFTNDSAAGDFLPVNAVRDTTCYGLASTTMALIASDVGA